MHADKYYFPKAEVHIACKLLPEHIRQKNKLRDTTHTKNKRNPKISEMNSEISSHAQ